MNRALSFCLALNLVYAQSAVVRESWFGSDKVKHFFMSAFIESLAFSGLQAVGVHGRGATAGAIGAAAAFGLGRELHDQRTPGKWFSYKDLAADVAGIVAGAFVIHYARR